MTSTDIKKHLACSTSWNDPRNAGAAGQFIQKMRPYQYGYNACNQAWAYFVDGWNARRVWDEPKPEKS